ncbi:MAG: hypothetical protein CMM50_06625 [Rhodospirillaceae bacterium]|nr:hypothetical protein [Rhodospirillaceae bacterium]
MARTVGNWEVPEEAFCREPTDYYRPAARKTMARVCADLFDTHYLTPLCFLHSPFHQRRLYDGGDLLGAFQITALAQSKKTGQNFRLRQKELADLFDQVVRTCRDKSKLFQNRRFRAADFPQIVAEIDGSVRNPQDRGFVLNAVLSFYLDNVKSWLAKMYKVIALYDPALDDEVVALLDSHLAEMVAGRTALTELLGSESGVGQVAIALMEIHDSQDDAVDKPKVGDVVTGEGTVAAISALVATGKFPETREAIADHLLAVMDSSRPFRASDREPELVAMHAVFERFQKCDPELQSRLHRALGRRIGQAMTVDNMFRFRDTEPEPAARLDKLLLFHRFATNVHQRQAIEDEIDVIFEGDGLYDGLVGRGTDLDEKLRIFSNLYGGLDKVSIETYRKLTMMKAIARMQVRFVREFRYFETIFENHTDVLALSRMLLDMFKSRVFLTGPCRDGAKRVIKQLIGGQAFQTAYLADAADDAEAAERVRVLREELESAGLLD